MNQLKVLMLGESLSKQGGIVSVEKLILSQSPSEVQIRHISTLEDGSRIHKILIFGRALGELLWRLMRREADLLHIHLSERGSTFRKAILTLIAVVLRKPVVMHAHGSEFPTFFSKLPQWVRRGLIQIFRRCTLFIVLSESWKKFYIDSLGLEARQVLVLPNPVKLPSQVPCRKGSPKVNFVFFGRIGERKGVFDLIQAFAALPPEQKTGSGLTLAGDGEVEQARRLVESLDLMDQVTVLDWLGPDQRDTLLFKADVFVLPSYNEGLPMALLEAMAWGLPVITTPVGGIPELVTQSQNGLLVNPGDIQQLSVAIQSLIEAEGLRLSLGSAARASVLSFDIKNYWCSLVSSYRSVLLSKEVECHEDTV